MELKDLIYVQEGFLYPQTISSFLQWVNTIDKFEEATVISEKNKKGNVVKNIRSVKEYNMTLDKGLTEAHWFNYFRSCFVGGLRHYEKHFAENTGTKKIECINILKYKEGDFYKVHSDYHNQFKRAISIILFLNNDYEGGNLVFHNAKNYEKEMIIKPGVGKFVMWPSGFMFPHSVEKVTKGERYALVSWLA